MTEQPSRQKTRNQQHAQWQQHIRAWQRSGQTRAVYCEQHGLNLQTFAYWRKRLKTQTSPVTLVQLPCNLQAARKASTVRIVVDDCFAIEVSDEFTPATLARAIEVVRGL